MRANRDINHINPNLGFAINGLYLTRNDLGITRYARELMREIDCLVKPGDLVVVAPEGTCDPNYTNVELFEFGKLSGIAWEQLDYSRFLRRTHLRSLNLMNTLPLFAPNGITVLHDISYKVNPRFFQGMRGRASRLWHMLNYCVAVRNSDPLVTVSEFSKSEIVRVYDTNPNNVKVVPNAWQHMERVTLDIAIIEKLNLSGKRFYYTLSSLAPNKNIGWVLSSAKLTPDAQFVIAGGSRIMEEFGRDLPRNVILPGFVTDEESKALLAHCEAFLFPTLYEGFGIPPLEALACGAAVVVSDTPCMHEVLGDAATYINPGKPMNLNEIQTSSPAMADDTLGRYNWRESAAAMLELLKTAQRTR